MDAKEYLLNTDNQYDVIIDDVFDYLSKVFYDFEIAYNKLKKGGWLLINMHKMSDFEKYKPQLEKLFVEIKLDTRRNICVFCKK